MATVFDNVTNVVFYNGNFLSSDDDVHQGVFLEPVTVPEEVVVDDITFDVVFRPDPLAEFVLL